MENEMGVFDYLEKRDEMKKVLMGESDRDVETTAKEWFESIANRVKEARVARNA